MEVGVMVVLAGLCVAVFGFMVDTNDRLRRMRKENRRLKRAIVDLYGSTEGAMRVVLESKNTSSRALLRIKHLENVVARDMISRKEDAHGEVEEPD